MSVTFSATVEPRSSRMLDRQLRAFSRDVKAYQKHARTIAGYVQKDAKANIRAQRNFDGGAFALRKAGKSKKALLRGLGRRIAVVSMAAQGGGAAVTWRNGFEAQIAGRHHWGIGEDWTPQKAKSVHGSPDYNAPCTAKQAKALIREGYKRRRKGKAPQRVNASELQEMFTIGQAGLILRMMQTGKAQGKQFWNDKVPSRRFLGVTPAKAEEYTVQLATRILNSTKQGKV